MGLFNDTDDSNRQDEVVIDAPEEDSSTETRLGQQVEDSLISDSESKSGSEPEKSLGGSDVSLDDIHRQNKTIIDLLEKLVDKKDSKSSGSRSKDRSTSRNSSRVTDRGSNSASRVTDRKDSSNDDSIGDGMNELL